MLEVLTVGSFCASLFYCLFTGTSILYALIFAFFLFCGYALYRGFSLPGLTLTDSYKPSCR